MNQTHYMEMQPGNITRVLLQTHSISPTRQRVAIGRVLFARHQHLTADQLLEQVNRHQTRVSRATVYNTLGLFVRKNLVQEIVVDGERIFYDTNSTPHQHLFNLDTNQLTDLPTQNLEVKFLKGMLDNVEMVGVDIMVRVRNRTQSGDQ